MKGVLVFTILFVLVVGKVSLSEIFPIQITKSVVFIETHDGFGSGVIIGTNYVLTCAHIDGEFLVLGTPSRLIKKDSRYDLAYIQTQYIFQTSQTVNFASLVNLGEHVWIVGHLIGKQMVIGGTVAAIDEDLLYLDAKVIEGFSGGGVFNDKGEFVGIYFAGMGKPDRIGLAHNLAKIYRFLGVDFSRAKIIK